MFAVPKLPKFLWKRTPPANWRDYQTGVTGPRRSQRRSASRRLVGVLLALATIAILYGVIQNAVALPPAALRTTAATAPGPEPMGREELRSRLDETAFNNLTEKTLQLSAAGSTLRVETTLDTGLQNYLLDKLDRTHSRYVGIVVMEAATGQVLAMAGFDKTDPAGNPCLRSQFPAASLFKMVTAAAAVDQCGFTADSPVTFTGPKHTLYKRQLTDKVNRYTTTIPLREAFAESVNPVFGKLGGLNLRQALLEQSASAFGFNEPLDFELPLPPSQCYVGAEPYHWAEVASGFNLDTTISPLHGAVMASAVLNGGRMVTPSIVEQIADVGGRVLYRRQAALVPRPAMSAKAATALGEMMETTIISGTARKAFRRHRQDQVLSRLQIGGKTGSIDNASHEVRYDWFVGFARERQGEGQVVVAAMVGHEKFIGIRASEYARLAISYYFSSPAGKVSLSGGSRPLAKKTLTSAPHT